MNSFGLYVHIPYCLAKCPYCDFNSYATSFNEETYVAALINELTWYSKDSNWKNRKIQTIFFGGGTPSLFSSVAIKKIITKCNELFGITSKAEVTLEANPGSIYEELAIEKLRDFLCAGVNRISMGAQSFSNKKLKQLGRIHQAEDTRKAVGNIKKAGFKNFNLDLMFGVLGEEISDWQFDLESVIELNPEHISAYSLTIEPGTEFGKLSSKGKILTADEDTVAEMYCLTQNLLKKNGYEQYEISNYAKQNRQCQHNLNYWNNTDYLGVGAGAHSYHSIGKDSAGTRWSNIPGPIQYIKRANEQGDSKQRKETITKELAEIEFFSLGLRTIYGINFDDTFNKRYQPLINNLSSQSLISVTDNTITLTPSGFLQADGIIEAFVTFN